MTTIAIIGCGFSGTATALNLLRLSPRCESPLKVLMIDRAPSIARGLAYGTEDDNLVLNVPIGNMSAFPDKPDDFLEYCTGMDSALISGSFVGRRLYGEYLGARLAQMRAEHRDQLVEIRDAVSAIVRHDGAFRITLESGTQLQAHQVVLALGHFPPRPLAQVLGQNVLEPGLDPARCLDNPWDIRALDRLPADEDVLIVGTGHTAIDTVFRLVSSPGTRAITLVSRHGHLPHGHRNAGEFVKLPLLSVEMEDTIRALLARTPTVRALCAQIRALARRHVAQGGNWRDIINGLRPLTPEIWGRLSARERARFLRHLVHHWDVLRHRLAPVAQRRLEALIRSGRVEVLAGRITAVRPLGQGPGMEVVLARRQGHRHAHPLEVLAVGSIINCSGPNTDIRRSPDPLVGRLVKDHVLLPDDLRLGFQVDADYRCCRDPDLRYVGPMLKAGHWEAIAVPELRVHALRVAEAVLSSLGKAESCAQASSALAPYTPSD